MKGNLFYGGKSVRCIHLSVDPEGRDVHFCRYDVRDDSFEDVLFLREIRLSVPENGCLEFSGFHSFGEERFDFLTVEFFPSRVMADSYHDSLIQKMSGRAGQTEGFIKRVRL